MGGTPGVLDCCSCSRQLGQAVLRESLARPAQKGPQARSVLLEQMVRLDLLVPTVLVVRLGLLARPAQKEPQARPALLDQMVRLGLPALTVHPVRLGKECNAINESSPQMAPLSCLLA